MNKPIDITTPAAFEHDCAEADSEIAGFDGVSMRGPLMPDTADIKIRPIGQIDNGSDGRDEYYLLTRLDDDMTPEQAHDWIFPRVYQECMGPGCPYVNTVAVVQAENSTNQVICTVQHRYDV